MKKVKKNRK